MGLSNDCAGAGKRLLPVKLHYFLFMAALACALPFRTVFAKQLGISATAVGVIFCVIPFLKIVANPLFGFVLDYFKRFRLTLSVIMIVLIIFHLAMILIPPRTTISHNIINISEQDFHSKLKYSCMNDTYSYGCDPSLIIYSEYTEKNKSKRGRSSFTCDIFCSDSTTVSTGINMLQCSTNVTFDIKLLIDVSNCDMDVTLESGKMLVMSEDIQNPILVNMNESSVIQFKSWCVPAGNCSEVASTQSDSSLEKYRKKHSELNASEEDYISTALKFSRHASPTVSVNLINSSSHKRYYALHKYKIKISSGNASVSGPCRSEFMCHTKNCYSEVQPDDFTSKLSVVDESEYQSAQFWGLFFLIALSSTMISAIIFMMDAICYEMLQGNRDKYGLQRLWGSIGWGVGALAGGYVNQIVTGGSGIVDYAPSFCLLAILMFIDLIPVFKLKITELKYSSHIWKDVCFLFSKFSIVYNVIMVYLVGVLSGFIWNYQFWFMEEIGSSQVLLGLSQTFECIFELPWFLVSGWIIRSIGHDQCNNITFLCFGLRYLCFVFMYDPWWTLAAGFFHGPTFGLFYASMTMYAKNEAPPGTEATVQSLLHLSFEGIGVATGTVLGGIGLDKLGSRTSFMYAAALSFLLLVVNIFMGILFSRTKRNSRQMPDSDSRP